MRQYRDFELQNQTGAKSKKGMQKYVNSSMLDWLAVVESYEILK